MRCGPAAVEAPSARSGCRVDRGSRAIADGSQPAGERRAGASQAQPACPFSMFTIAPHHPVAGSDRCAKAGRGGTRAQTARHLTADFRGLTWGRSMWVCLPKDPASVCGCPSAPSVSPAAATASCWRGSCATTYLHRRWTRSPPADRSDPVRGRHERSPSRRADRP